MPDEGSGKPIIQGDDQPREELIFENPVVDADDEVLDIFEPDDHEGRALRDDLHRHFGGPQGYEAAASDLREAVGVMDPAGAIAKAIEGIPRSEENAAIKEMVSDWRAILADPERARALLQKIYKDRTHPYFRGEASPETGEGITKLFQAAHREPPTGRPRP
jgi:hypothetical protein